MQNLKGWLLSEIESLIKVALRRMYLIISVQSWNFKDGGSLKALILAKNQHTQRIKKKSYDE